MRAKFLRRLTLPPHLGLSLPTDLIPEAPCLRPPRIAALGWGLEGNSLHKRDKPALLIPPFGNNSCTAPSFSAPEMGNSHARRAEGLILSITFDLPYFLAACKEV